tara:strand:- start:362 stop:577 length:216 start_codon:yes stop_codon:yes gene_type:complete
MDTLKGVMATAAGVRARRDLLSPANFIFARTMTRRPSVVSRPARFERPARPTQIGAPPDLQMALSTTNEQT